MTCVSFILLKGQCCDIIVVNLHVPSEDRDNDIQNSFYDEIDRPFDQLPVYLTKILLNDFKAKVG